MLLSTFKRCSNSGRLAAVTLVAALIWCAATAFSAAQTTDSHTPADADRRKLFESFTDSMRNVRLKGQFTVVADGNVVSQKEETYEIRRVEKLAKGNQWRFYARIRYGRIDVTLPLTLDVLWAGSTPVITLDSVAIPGLGTFDGRVLFQGNRYVGTWQHGDKGGHLYGTIERIDPHDASGKKEGGTGR